jgi:hypothetical protein
MNPSMNRSGDAAQAQQMSPCVYNLIPGSVEAISQGLTLTGIRVKVGSRALLRIRWSSESYDEPPVQIAQRIVARIPADAVLLGAIGIWPGKNRWNRWAGRIVLVEEDGATGLMITVKLRGECLTLKSPGPVIGLGRRPQTWDLVNIVVDPTRVTQVVRIPSLFFEPSHWTTENTQMLTGTQVWMKGRVEGVRQVTAGPLLSLRIGDAHVHALVSQEQKTLWCPEPDTEVQIHVGHWEAWVKPLDQDVEPISCSLLYAS